MPDLGLLVNLLQLAVKDRTQLALENIALRHQLAVMQRVDRATDQRDGQVIATPVLGGLHHRYSRVA